MLTCGNCGRESPDDFTFCPACGSSLSPASAPVETRKVVTVVFCDVTGSTALGERLDPESLRRVMSRYFDGMRTALERHGGTVEKFIGDAVMAVFGVPQVHEDDALRAVRAAAEMRTSLGVLNKELERDHGISFQARIGVNTGEVVSGDGSDGSLVIGDAVNVAARLEQAADPGSVLLGETTMRLVRDAVIAEPIDPLEVKGKAEPLTAFRLVEVTSATTGVARRLDSPMVGRERQLSQLRQAFDAAVADRSCQLFTVLGAPGVGKSRLVEEFLAGAQADATVLRGRCLPYGDGITFFPVGEVVKEGAGLEDFDEPEEIERKICAVLGDGEPGTACSTLAQLFGASDRDSAPEETFWAVRRFLESAAQAAPLAVVFDDIHWGEGTFLDLIEHIADWSRDAPILVLCMARPELLDLRPSWGGGKFNASTILLEPLSDEDCVALIGNLLRHTSLPDEARDRILQAADGTPLFVEEMLAMLIDDGLLAREDRRWVATGDLTELSVPPTIQALLAARLDRLSSDERAVIQRAAVAGKQFHVGAVTALLAGDPPQDVRGPLMGLVRRDLIGPDRSTLAGDDAFRFRHLLIRDTAYESAPKAARAQMHERFADWLVDVAGDRLGEQEEILAYHLERAYRLLEELGPLNDVARALGVRAAHHYESSAHRATERGDYAAAARLLGRGADLLPDGHPALPGMRYESAHARLEGFEAPLALAAADEAIAAAVGSGQPAIEWLARLERTEALMLADPNAVETEAARAEVDEALRLFQQLGDERGLAVASLKRNSLAWLVCRFDDAREAAVRAADHARRAGNRRIVVQARTARVAAMFHGSSTPDECRDAIHAMIDELGAEGLPGHAALVLESHLAAYDGDFDTARRLSDEGFRFSERIGSDVFTSVSAERRGDIEFIAGDLREAERWCRMSEEGLARIGDAGHRSYQLGSLAIVLCGLGELDEAERSAELAIQLASVDDLGSVVRGRIAQVLVRSARAQHDDAARIAIDTIELFADAQAPAESGDLFVALAEAYLGGNRREEAAEAARTALDLYERKGFRPAVGKTLALIEAIGGA